MAKRIRLEPEPARSTPKAAKRAGSAPHKKKQKNPVKLPPENESDSKGGDYKVGRGKPPKNTQFRKGDGRKRPGRPKGSKNMVALIMEAANEQFEISIDGKKRKISKAQAAAMQLANAGAKGNEKLLLKFIDLIADIEAARPSEYPFSDADIKVIRETYKRLRPYDERRNG